VDGIGSRVIDGYLVSACILCVFGWSLRWCFGGAVEGCCGRCGVCLSLDVGCWGGVVWEVSDGG